MTSVGDWVIQHGRERNTHAHTRTGLAQPSLAVNVTAANEGTRHFCSFPSVTEVAC